VDVAQGAAIADHRVGLLRLELRDPFRIARSERGRGESITTVIVELRDERFPDLVGLGEGFPDEYYGDTPETMAAAFPVRELQALTFATLLGQSAFSPLPS